MSAARPKTEIAVYPCSFDPLTNGYLDVVDCAPEIFDRLIAAVASNPEKRQPLFTVKERMQMITASLKDRENVEVAVEVAKLRGATTLVKGLRVYSDFDAELQQALVNRKLAPDIHTACTFFLRFRNRMRNEVGHIAAVAGDVVQDGRGDA